MQIYSNMAAVEAKCLGSENIPTFLASVDTFLFDCDGVLWTGATPLPGSIEVITRLQEMGKRICYVTNNSTKSRAKYLEKLLNLGFPAKEDDIYCTSYLAAYYLKNVLNFTGKVYMIGNPGIAEEFEIAGISYIGAGPDPIQTDGFSEASSFDIDPEVNAVVVGFDPHINYRKITIGANYLDKESCLFIATNTDDRFPTSDGRVAPGTGVHVTCMETASRRKATVLGKPEKTMFECMNNKLHLDPKRTCMVGDRINTDILLGRRQGLQTLLVFTGVSKLADLEELKQNNKDFELPHYYLDSLGDLRNGMTS